MEKQGVAVHARSTYYTTVYNDSIRSDDDASDDTTMCPKELWN